MVGARGARNGCGSRKNAVAIVANALLVGVCAIFPKKSSLGNWILATRRRRGQLHTKKRLSEWADVFSL